MFVAGNTAANAPDREMILMSNTTTATATAPAVSVETIFASVTYGDVTDYRTAPVKIKNAVRRMVDDAMMSAIADTDMVTAKIMADATKMIKAAPAATDAPTVDYTTILGDRIMALRVAASMIKNGDVTPDGIDRGAIDADRLATILNGRPSADAIAAGRAIAGTKITRSADRRDIGAHVIEVMSRYDAGVFVSIRDIAKSITSAYPADVARPSDGAVAARLFPVDPATKMIKACTIPGVTRVDATATSPRGCTRNA